MKSELIQFRQAILDWRYAVQMAKSPAHRIEREKAEIIRLVHSVEKGLCIENPRPGFGVKKITDLFTRCDRFISYNPDSLFCVKMAYGALEQYISYHQRINFNSPEFDTICKKTEELKKYIPADTNFSECGGIAEISNALTRISIDDVSHVFNARHSIRAFSTEKIKAEEISESVRIAQRVPSACNRQAVRVYAIESDKLRSLYPGGMEGVGGFADQADRFLLITGKTTAYRLGEKNQYIVSASMFASYLSLALSAFNIGSCIIQRPLGASNQWKAIRNALSIPEDELLVVLLAIGKYKEDYCVPVSGRFPTEEILLFK